MGAHDLGQDAFQVDGPDEGPRAARRLRHCRRWAGRERGIRSAHGRGGSGSSGCHCSQRWARNVARVGSLVERLRNCFFPLRFRSTTRGFYERPEFVNARRTKAVSFSYSSEPLRWAAQLGFSNVGDNFTCIRA